MILQVEIQAGETSVFRHLNSVYLAQEVGRTVWFSLSAGLAVFIHIPVNATV